MRVAIRMRTDGEGKSKGRGNGGDPSGTGVSFDQAWGKRAKSSRLTSSASEGS